MLNLWSMKILHLHKKNNTMKQILTEEEIMKERALKNAEMITEEELRENYFTPEEFSNLIIL